MNKQLYTTSNPSGNLSSGLRQVAGNGINNMARNQEAGSQAARPQVAIKDQSISLEPIINYKNKHMYYQITIQSGIQAISMETIARDINEAIKNVKSELTLMGYNNLTVIGTKTK